MRITIITMVLVLLAILIGGCDVQVSESLGKNDEHHFFSSTSKEGKIIGRASLRGTWKITVYLPDGSPAPIWYKELDSYWFITDGAILLDGYVAHNEDFDFEVLEGETLHFVLLDPPVENGEPSLHLISRVRALKFTDGGEGDIFTEDLEIDVDVGDSLHLTVVYDQDWQDPH